MKEYYSACRRKEQKKLKIQKQQMEEERSVDWFSKDKTSHFLILVSQIISVSKLPLVKINENGILVSLPLPPQWQVVLFLSLEFHQDPGRMGEDCALCLLGRSRW